MMIGGLNSLTRYRKHIANHSSMTSGTAVPIGRGRQVAPAALEQGLHSYSKLSVRDAGLHIPHFPVRQAWGRRTLAAS